MKHLVRSLWPGMARRRSTAAKPRLVCTRTVGTRKRSESTFKLELLEEQPARVKGYDPYDTAGIDRYAKDLWRFKPKRS